MRLTFVANLLLCGLVWSQALTGSYVKYDYCVRGPDTCLSPLCGNNGGSITGWCIAESYVTLNCTASGLGVNQPARDPNVVSLINCNNEGGLRTNFSSLADCYAFNNAQTPTYVRFSSLGYSSFCWGGPVSAGNSPFSQFNLSLGYSLTLTLLCPSEQVTAVTFLEDPYPSTCVPDVQSCAGQSSDFVLTTTCYPGLPPPPPTPPTPASASSPPPPADQGDATTDSAAGLTYTLVTTLLTLRALDLF